ncbi:MAG: hypothetical protein KC897_13220, partial [Candidatus Omnitrophica bacterium]|nr:hypothetical protein [Candidatus Omnitrophota bacterium]
MDYDTLINVVKSDLTVSYGVGYILLSGLFPLSAFLTYIGAFKQQVNWSWLIVRLVIGFVLLDQYEFILDTTRLLVQGLHQALGLHTDYVAQYQRILEQFQTLYES